MVAATATVAATASAISIAAGIPIIAARAIAIAKDRAMTIAIAMVRVDTTHFRQIPPLGSHDLTTEDWLGPVWQHGFCYFR